MEDISRLVYDAQNDSRKLNKLIEDFLPFIKRCVSQSRVTKQSQDDVLTLAMLTADCVMAYQPDKGQFVAYVQTSIRNRLIDDYRSEQRFISRSVPLLEENAESDNWETKLSVEEYQRQLEKDSLRLEIENVTKILSAWNTSFAELAMICPKQKRTRTQCEYIATLLLKNEVWRTQLIEKHRLPSKEMCNTYGASAKILEKYRKYIAALCVIQSEDYPMLHTFLPMNRKGGIMDD